MSYLAKEASVCIILVLSNTNIILRLWSKIKTVLFSIKRNCCITIAGIKGVVCEKMYRGGYTIDFSQSAGVELKILTDEMETYPQM